MNSPRCTVLRSVNAYSDCFFLSVRYLKLLKLKYPWCYELWVEAVFISGHFVLVIVCSTTHGFTVEGSVCICTFPIPTQLIDFFYTLPSGACSSGHNDPTNHVIQTLENRPFLLTPHWVSVRPWSLVTLFRTVLKSREREYKVWFVSNARGNMIRNTVWF